MARPSEFSDDAEASILQIISEGGTLDQAAKAAKVTRSTVCRWLQDDQSFRDKYARAREDQGDWFADKIADLAIGTGKEPADITARVNALKWLAAKRKPKVYGDKIVAEHTGRDGKDLPAPTPVTIFQLPDNGRG